MQEEELSVSEILSSIRQVLSKEAEALNSEIDKTKAHALKTDSPLSKVHTDTVRTDLPVLELTPNMRVTNDSLLSAETALKTQAALEKLNQVKTMTASQKIEGDLRPLLQDWLNANLPQIVERIVTEEVRRIINQK